MRLEAPGPRGGGSRCCRQSCCGQADNIRWEGIWKLSDRYPPTGYRLPATGYWPPATGHSDRVDTRRNSPTVLKGPEGGVLRVWKSKRRYVYAGDRRVHYRRAGAGPPLVMLHASPGSSYVLRPLIELMARSRTVIAIDTPRLRGVGRSGHRRTRDRRLRRGAGRYSRRARS